MNYAHHGMTGRAASLAAPNTLNVSSGAMSDRGHSTHDGSVLFTV